MKAQKQALVQELTHQLAPQLSRVAPTGEAPPKGVVKALRYLAEQLERAQVKQQKRVATKVTPKQAKQKLSDELALVLNTHFSDQGLAEIEGQILTETAEELAEKLTKVRAKQARKKKAPQAEEESEEADSARPAKQPKRRTANH